MLALQQHQLQQLHQVRCFGSKRRKNRRRDAHKYRGAANADFVEDSDGYDDVFGFKPSSRSERRRGQQRSRRQRALETPLDWAFVDGRKARHKMQQLEQLHGRRRGRAAPRRSGGLRALQHKRREKLMKVLADLPNALSLRDMVAEFAPLTDMSQPHQWYPAARAIKRRIVLHVGPTNSGKTHAALQRLAAADSGIYCGPLRLLAWEVFERLNAEGTPCSLLTGQEQEEVDGALHTSCTVEMAATTSAVDVVVLDEIQMLDDRDRGWAWTRMLLGAQSPEVHVCGDARAVELVQALCKLTGDEVEVVEYERLSPLEQAKHVVYDVADIEPGDCVVAFSRRDLFALRRLITKATGLSVGMIYGRLPPQVRREQAQLFNAPNGGTDVLVATDAIGMGLNLAIRRIVFSDIQKFDGERTRALTIPELKQIGGRAGRFGSDFPTGEVAVMQPEHVRAIRRAMQQPSPDATIAGVFPEFEQVQEFVRVATDAILARGLGLSAEDLAAVSAQRATRRRRAGAGPSVPQWRVDDASMESSDEDGVALGSSEEEEEEEWSSDEVSGADDDDDDWSSSEESDGYDSYSGDEAEEGEETEEGEWDSSADSDDYEYTTPEEAYRSVGREDLEDHLHEFVQFSHILQLFFEASRVGNQFFLSGAEDTIANAKLVDHLRMNLADRWRFCLCPVTRDNICESRFVQFATAYTKHSEVPLHESLDMANLPAKVKHLPEALESLERTHSVCDTYIYLSQRYPDAFTDTDKATAVVGDAEALIKDALERLSSSSNIRRKLQKKRQKAAKSEARRRRRQEVRARKAAAASAASSKVLVVAET